MATSEAAADFPNVSKRACPMCGEPVSLSAKTCGACGEKIDDTASRKKAELTGIGGWLILPAIGAVISPPLYLFGGGALVLAAAAGGGILPGGARGMLGAGGALLVALGLFSIYVAVMFFMKKRIAPTLMIARYALDLVLGWVMVGITAAAAAGNATETAKDFGGAVRSTVIAVVWIAYFVQSQRVKNTFVN